MSLINYHEMTLDEPRDSPARRQQFMVICTVISILFLHGCITGGVFQSIEVTRGVFPGGHFIYKYAQRDYAASMSLEQHITQQDLKGSHLLLPPTTNDDKDNDNDNDNVKEKTTETKNPFGIYHLYLDNPTIMGGRRQRWMTGLLLVNTDDDDHNNNKNNNNGEDTNKKHTTSPNDSIQTFLLSKNKNIPTITPEQERDLPVMELWPKVPYEQGYLPSTDALILSFPFTNGFVSALVFSYKVIRIMMMMMMMFLDIGYNFAFFCFVFAFWYTILTHQLVPFPPPKKSPHRSSSETHPPKKMNTR